MAANSAGASAPATAVSVSTTATSASSAVSPASASVGAGSRVGVGLVIGGRRVGLGRRQCRIGFGRVFGRVRGRRAGRIRNRGFRAVRVRGALRRVGLVRLGQRLRLRFRGGIDLRDRLGIALGTRCLGARPGGVGGGLGVGGLGVGDLGGRGIGRDLGVGSGGFDRGRLGGVGRRVIDGGLGIGTGPVAVKRVGSRRLGRIGADRTGPGFAGGVASGRGRRCLRPGGGRLGQVFGDLRLRRARRRHHRRLGLHRVFRRDRGLGGHGLDRRIGGVCLDGAIRSFCLDGSGQRLGRIRRGVSAGFGTLVSGIRSRVLDRIARVARPVFVDRRHVLGRAVRFGRSTARIRRGPAGRIGILRRLFRCILGRLFRCILGRGVVLRIAAGVIGRTGRRADRRRIVAFALRFGTLVGLADQPELDPPVGLAPRPRCRCRRSGSPRRSRRR